jgi:TolB-like protein
MRRGYQATLVALILVVCLFSSGCNLILTPIAMAFHKPYVTLPAEYDLSQRGPTKVLVVPFKETGGFYYQSEIGESLAEHIEIDLAQNITNLRIVDSNRVLAGTTPVDLETADWGAIGEEFGADFILLGETTFYQTRMPNSPNLLSGEIGMHVRLLETYAGGAIAWAKKISSYYPEPTDQRTTGIPTFKMTEQVLEQKLLANASKDIVNKFYPRKVKRLEKGREEIY